MAYYYSEENLSNHRFECQDLGLWIIPKPNVFPCDECGITSTSMEELLGPMNTYHQVGTVLEDSGVEMFYCDIWPLLFENDCNLQFHRRGCHWNHV